MKTDAPDLILAVGNSMMGDDGAGPMLADLMKQKPLAGWEVEDGGSAPENAAHRIAARAPRRVVLVDAADMGLAPGEIRRVPPEALAEMFIMSTHDLPLSFLMERLAQTAQQVEFVGIQPDLVAFYCPMTEPVRQAVDTLYAALRDDPALDSLPWLSDQD
ncbi:hydrogenase maturation peptidase HycI [Chromobacterium alticapitis]|uniref:Hydrogenase maturation peptidase HycI n=1 Tax=Chromobacterium alticapitis TaxID=2073169 RepID=A0A2S5DCM5_9NEIS|nr:hydrogenase maturation peptidase HycI [Chromobacterium alticapitis]POZ60843.1 hydrogenase maturation peptidase HycI [Chromobacterium alticapitis]